MLPDTEAAATLAELLRGAGVTVELDPDFSTAAWRKLLVNSVVGFMVLTGRRSGIFRRDDVAALGRRYLAECLAVARAEGADLGDEVIDEIVDMLAQSPPDITTSMLTDREAASRWNGTSATASSCARRRPTGSRPRSARWWCRCSQPQATAPARHPALLCMAIHQRERVGLDFIAGAPFRFVSTVDLTITPEQVFEVLDDAGHGRIGPR